MAVAPGTRLTFEIDVGNAETFEGISGTPVALQQFDAGFGDFRPLQTAVTDNRGQAIITIQAPATPGRYRYRSAWAGNAAFRPDTSPDVTVEVAAAP